MATIINGADLMLFVGEGTGVSSIACATNCTVTMNMETTDVSAPGHKDIGSSGTATAVTWAEFIPQTNSWTMSTENLFSTDGEGKKADDLFTYWHNGTLLDAQFGLVDPHEAVATGGYTSTTGTHYSGKVYITNLTWNAPYEGKATLTAEFQGTGELQSSASN